LPKRYVLDSSTSSSKPPTPKRRKSDRIANQLSKKVVDSPRSDEEKSPEVGSSNGNKKKDIKHSLNVISHKKNFTRLNRGHRNGVKSSAKQNAPLSPALLLSSKMSSNLLFTPHPFLFILTQLISHSRFLIFYARRGCLRILKQHQKYPKI
uniref:Ovule protein n=1 Tax=Brugia pahangi TaxID=6280 RepID=A0A0N4THW6_BRUPA